MGRHTAADGRSVHPLVAEGLARRTGGPATHGTADPGQHSSDIGWPAPPTRGDGLGWPGDLPDDDGDAPPSEPAPQSRRGWRRLLRSRPAA